jgi:4,5-dihydroxyphthalate decarboxylase
MSEPSLRTVSRTQGANIALKTGEVQPHGYRLEFEEVPVLVHAFRRMVRALEFDVCEMALTTYLCAREHGVPFTAIPTFLVRGLHHGAVVRAADTELALPDGLHGTRIGVNRGYTVTTGVWARGILETEYGVDLDRITWVLSGDEHVSDYRPPDNVVPMPADADLADMVVAGELAAAIGVKADRPDLTTVVPDADEAAFRALKDHGLYPINHLVVVRDELLADDPALAVSLFEAFAEAKQRQVERLAGGETLHETEADELHRRVMVTTGDDPLPYGLAPNRGMLERLLDHAARQGILTERPRLEDVFAEGTHDLLG